MGKYASFEDIQFSPDPANDLQPDLGYIAGQGLRAGTYGALSQGSKLAGTVADAITPGMGRGLHGFSDSTLAEAQRSSAHLTPLEDVRDLSSGLRWAVGGVSASAPMAAAATAAGLATGGGVLPAALAGGAVLAPFEAGEIIRRGEGLNTAATPAERLQAAALPALGSAAAQSIVPAGVAARLAGRAGSAATKTAKQIGLRAAADVPMEGAAEGAGEFFRQVGDNQLAPTTGYDLGAIGRNALEGAALGGVMGTVGAAGDMAHKIASTPGSVVEALTGPAQTAKTAIQSAVSGAGDAISGAVRGAEPVAAQVAQTAETKTTDFGASLRRFYDSSKATGSGLLARMARGEDTVDPNAADPAAAQAEADQTAFARAKKWADELATENLGPEKAQQLKAAASNLADRANRQTVAALRRGQDAIKRVTDAVGRFNTAVNDRAAETKGVKKSDDFSGAREVIGKAIMSVLPQDHPALQDAKLRGQLADGLRKYIQQVADGKVFDSLDKLDQIEDLYGAVGEDTTALLAAVHRAVSNAGKDDQKVFKNLNQLDAILSGRQGVVETLQKNLSPALQNSVTPEELRTEAQMLMRWARSRTGNGPGEQATTEDAVAQFNDNQVRSALQTRYGDKADLVMKAVEAQFKAERNAIVAADEARARPMESDDDMRDGAPVNEGKRTGKLEDESARVDVIRQNGQLYLDPEIDDDPSPHGNAAQRRMSKAKKENPNAEVRFRKASELGRDHPAVKAKFADLLDAAEAEGLKGDAATAWAEKHLDKFGAVTIEQSRQDTSITLGELNTLRLNTTKYGKSPARLNVDKDTTIDAARLTEHMHSKMKEYTDADDKGKPYRMARMFVEGVAALQERVGHRIELSDDLQITRGELRMTWGDAKKLLSETDGKSTPNVRGMKDGKPVPVPGSARISNQVARAEKVKAGIEAKVRAAAEPEIERLKAAGIRLTTQNVGDAYRRAREPFAAELAAIDREIFALERQNLEDDRPRTDEDGAIDQPTAERAARARRLNEISEELDALREQGLSQAEFDRRSRPLRREWEDLEEINARAGEQMGRTEIDPFGPTHDALRGKDNPKAAIRTNADGSARDDTVMGRRRPAQSVPTATRGLYEAPGRKLNPVEGEATPISQGKELGSPAVQVAKAMSKGTAPARALARKMFALIDHKGLSAKDEAVLDAIAEIPNVSDRAPAINRMFEKYQPELTEVKENSTAKTGEFSDNRLMRPMTEEEAAMPSYELPSRAGPELRAAVRAAVQGSAPSPKVAAAKKAAFLQRALSGDAELIEALKSSDDIKGLQRAADALLSVGVRSKNVLAALDATNTRIEELLNADTAYGLQTKRYSLMSAEIHSALGRPGFAATHNSPTKHEGKFDWRTHAEKGGGMVKGAGTYLSTNDSVHKYYKKLFTKDGVAGPTYHLSVDIEPHQLMKWDAPLSSQSETVQAAASKLAADYGLDTTDQSGEDFYRALSEAAGSDREASELLQAEGVLGHHFKSAGKDGENTPNYVIYDDSKIHTNYVHFDKQTTTPGQNGPINRQEVYDYLLRTHGNSISVAWKNILHAGEFERTASGDVIRLSIHSLNPMSTAFHESLHGFFAKLRDAKQDDVTKVLESVASGSPVMNQLRKLLANEPDALAQLSDPEEAAAYMYQFWAAGKLNVGPKTDTLFQRVAAFIRKVTGLWTNDERALHILEYFHSGQYEANRGDANAVHRAMMETRATAALRKLDSFTKPLTKLSDSLMSAGGERLRDTGIPALRELADAMKLKTTTEGDDVGYVPAARAERSRVMNEIARDLKPYGEDAINEALEALQNGTRAKSLAARTVALMVNKRLQELLTYMQDAGVQITALGMTQGAPYFPRSWDASYIASHQRQFLAMMDKYVQSGEFKGDPQKLLQKLMVTDGSEFTVEVDKPGMQMAKRRVLDFIKHADAAPFMRKDMFAILNNYVTQATRRAEWARRFGDDGKGITQLMSRAVAEGATPEQIDTARDFVKAVDGTLGDSFDPNLRRLTGNMIVYQNIRLLPLAIFSSVVDPMGIIVRGGTAGEAFTTFKRGLRETVKNFQKEPTGDSLTELAEAIGTIDSAALTRTIGASYSQGMVGDRGRQLNDMFFRLNLMEQFNTSMRVGATQAAMSFIVRHASKPSPHSVRFLRELGLDASDVRVRADGKLKVLESDGLTLEQAAKMKAAVNRWVDGAVLRPDAVDKPIWMSDPHFALIAHLKQFVFSFHETILKRVVHEARNGNFAPGMALASYVPIMIAADYLKGLIQGGGDEPSWKQSWGLGDYVWSGMERAGVFGVGQFGIDALSDVSRGGVGIGALVGPTLEQLGEAVQVLGGRRQFGSFTLDALPANALYSSLADAEAPTPIYAE